MQMQSYVILHLLQLKSGMHIARSTEFPDCVGRSFERVGAVRLLERSLTEKIHEMIAAGERPPLYSFEEVDAKWSAHCKRGLPEPERLPGTQDILLIRRLNVQVDLNWRPNAA